MKGWEIVQYGPNKSRAKTLELTADHAKERFSVNVEFWEKRNDGDSDPKLIVNVISACYEVPEGENADQY